MTLLLKKVRIKDPKSTWYDQTVDLFINNGRIEDISPSIKAIADQEIDGGNKDLFPGLIDIGLFGGEPGFEHRETISSLLASAAAGGFSDVFYYPNLNPVTQSISEVEYLKKRASGHPCNLHPIGAISRGCNGEDITEMYDMAESGVKWFSDGNKPILHGGLLLRALLYVKKLDGLIMNHPMDGSIFPEGHIHEGEVSTELGLRGIPDISETIMLERDLHLLEYTGSRLHVSCVSTAKSVQLIKAAKAKGLKVTASVPYWHLYFDDVALKDFDSNFKMLPPLRSNEDKSALIAGLKDGTLDCMTTNHHPLDQEQKSLEFPYASPGAAGLQIAWPFCSQYLKDHFNDQELIQFWVDGPAKIMGLKRQIIDKDQFFNAFIYDSDVSFELNKINNRSKSINYPIWGQKIDGAITASFHKQYTNTYF